MVSRTRIIKTHHFVRNLHKFCNHSSHYLNNGSTEILITANETLSDGTMATISSDYHSHLTLSNINRVWNGATVHCAANAGSGSVDHDQPEPFPVISVLCELLQNIVNKLCYN